MKKLLLAFLLGVFLSNGFSLTHVLAGDNYRLQAVTVRSGDTLWTIAQEWSDPDEDVRDVIDRIVTANKLSSSAAIGAGQQLVIPLRDHGHEAWTQASLQVKP